MDAVLQSLLHTRMPQSAVRTAARDGVYSSVYREMAADFVKYLSPIRVVADGNLAYPRRRNVCPGCLFPRLLEGRRGRIFEHLIWLRARMLEMYDETASNSTENILRVKLVNISWTNWINDRTKLVY